MSLQFIGNAGIYFPERDAVRFTAMAGNATVECFVNLSALEAMGCRGDDPVERLVEAFESHRIDCELAALRKYRRATTKIAALEIGAADIEAAVEHPHAA